MIEQSDNIADLAAALSKVQANIEGAVKGKTNPAFKAKYADLASVWNACREQLTANNLSVAQFPGEMIDNRMTMTTQLMHSSGQWMRSTLSIPLGKVDAQGYGSATTYARRYALAAVVGVCPDDDDGNAAAAAPIQQSNRPASAAKPSDAGPVITPAQRQEIMDLAVAKGINAKTICEVGGINAISEMPAKAFDRCMAWIAKQPAKPAPNPQSSEMLADEIPY